MQDSPEKVIEDMRKLGFKMACVIGLNGEDRAVVIWDNHLDQAHKRYVLESLYTSMIATEETGKFSVPKN